MYVIPSLLIGDRFQTLSTLTGRSFLFMRNEQLGSTTAVILLVLAVGVVVGSSWLARRLGSSTMTRDRNRAPRPRSDVARRAVTVVFLMTPLVVTVAVSFGSSSVFSLPPPELVDALVRAARQHARPAGRRCWSRCRSPPSSTVDRAGARHALRHRPGARPLPGREVDRHLPGLAADAARPRGRHRHAAGLQGGRPARGLASLLVAHVVITLPYVVRTVLGRCRCSTSR